MTSRLAAWYAAPRTGTNRQSGQRRLAVRIGMAECTPNTRASYDAALTTPRSLAPPMPTTSGLPRQSGLSRCSTAAKNASRSTCRIVRTAGAAVTRQLLPSLVPGRLADASRPNGQTDTHGRFGAVRSRFQTVAAAGPGAAERGPSSNRMENGPWNGDVWL